MQEAIKRYRNVLIIDLIIFIFCLIGLVQVAQKAALPFGFSDGGGMVISPAGNISPALNSGANLLAIDGYNFDSREELELYTDGKNIGDTVSISILHEGKKLDLTVKLITCYSLFYLLTACITGFIFFIIAVLVFLKATEKKAALAFHNVVIATAMIIMMTWGNYNIIPHGLGHVIRFGFHAAYSFAPVLFLHFTFVFPWDRLNKRLITIMYTVSFFIMAVLDVIFLLAVLKGKIGCYDNYIAVFNFCRMYLVASVIAALAIFIHAFIKTKSVIEKKKLKWILLGLLIGPSAFILLWVVPQSITTYGLIPEEAVILLMTSVPIAFGIAIVRYHLLDIDLIIRRSIIYSVVVILLLAAYLILIIGISALVNYSSSGIISIVAAVIIALLSQPVKNKVQDLIDRKFYHVNYNFRIALENLFKAISDSTDIDVLTTSMSTNLQKIIPVEKCGFVFSDEMNYFYGGISGIFNSEISKLIFNSSSAGMFRALKNHLEPGLAFEILDDEILIKNGLVASLPVVNSAKKIKALFLIGAKKSGEVFTFEDVDLLQKLAAQTGLVIERLKLQESIIREKLEKEKLEELNRIKSLFVSGVSHELKTPLTSIRMFAELMSAPEISYENRKEYFQIIEGESNRLTNMINNILNITKIERGIKEYNLSEVDLNDVLKRVLNIFRYQFNSFGFKVNLEICNEKLNITGDESALQELLYNLFSNAVKYSKSRKYVEIKSYIERGRAVINIADNGIGIEETELEKIFEPFYRSGSPEVKRHTEGAGLGLSIVKHIVEAHRGTIKYISEIGEGTAVTVAFPLTESKP